MYTLKPLIAKATVPVALAMPAGNRQLIYWSLFLCQNDMVYLYIIGLATLNVIKNLLVTPYFSVMVFGLNNSEIERYILIIYAIGLSTFAIIHLDFFHFCLVAVVFGDVLLQHTVNRHIIATGSELPIKRLIYLSFPYLLLVLIFLDIPILLIYAIVLNLQGLILWFQYKQDNNRILRNLDKRSLDKKDYIWYTAASSLGLIVSSVWRLYYKDSPEDLVTAITILNLILIAEHVIGISKNLLIRYDKNLMRRAKYQNVFFIFGFVTIASTIIIEYSEYHLVIVLLLFAKSLDLGRGWLKTRLLSLEMPKSYFAAGLTYFVLSVLSLEFFYDKLSVTEMVSVISFLGAVIYILVFTFGNRRIT